MKLRRENSGLHMFDRESGIHVLLEEIRYSNSLLCKSPRTVSIALTNRCDLHCDFCYTPKGRQMIEFADLQNLVVALDNCGVLEITLGGGEPLLHPEFIDICKWIWESTSMATSVTTHGHHLTSEIIRRLTGRLSSIRFSIDGLEPYYSSVRGRPLSHLLPIVTLARQSIFTGINIVDNFLADKFTDVFLGFFGTAANMGSEKNIGKIS